MHATAQPRTATTRTDPRGGRAPFRALGALAALAVACAIAPQARAQRAVATGYGQVGMATVHADPAMRSGAPALGQSTFPSTEPALAPGEYDWHPELSPAGDVVVVVSLPEQEVHVYRGGVRIGRSTISSGRPGHETPTGVFPILQKQRMHHSNLYNDAAMPFMQRLTWDGIALHAGHLPGHPASHGCIRLPMDFAKALYGVTDRDGIVIVADDMSFGPAVVSPGPTTSPELMAVVNRARLEADGGDGTTLVADEPAASPAVAQASDVGASM